MAENNVILQVQDVTMQFGGLRAIDNVSFHVDEAEIFGLIGPNGAGKTTLFNVITANYKPTSGSVTLAGTSLKGLKPNQVVNAGIARTFQNIRLFNSMTVLENVMVGLDRASRYSLLEAALHIGRYFPAERAAKAKAMAILEDIGIGQELMTNIKLDRYDQVSITLLLIILVVSALDMLSGRLRLWVLEGKK